MRFVTSAESDHRQSTGSSLASPEHFRLFVEQVTDYAIFMLDPNGVVATWNLGAQRLKGYRAEEIIGQHFSRFYPADAVAAGKPERELADARRDGRVEDEGWRVRKDGTRFWANVVITAIRDDAGSLVGFAKVTRDLTERKRAEEERLRLEHAIAAREATTRLVGLLTRLHTLGGSLAAAQSPEEIATSIVEQGASALGARAAFFAEADEGRLKIVRTHGVPAAFLDAWRRLPADARTVAGEAYASRSPRWVEGGEQLRREFAEIVEPPGDVSIAALPLVLGDRVFGVVSFHFEGARHFTAEERVLLETMAGQAAQALARAEAHAEQVLARIALNTTLRSIGDAVIATDDKGCVTLMNPVAENLTRWNEVEARGRPLTDVFRIVNEHTRATVPNPVEKVLELGVVVGLANHTVLIARDGREIPIDDSGAPIRSDGEIQGVVLVFRDVSEKKDDEARRAFLADATALLSESLDYNVTLSKVAHLAVPRLAVWCAVDILEAGDVAPKRLAVAHVDPAKVALARDLAARYPAKPDAPRGVANVLRTGRAELYADIPDELLITASVDEEHLRLMRELQLRSAMIVPLATRGRVLGAMTFVHAASDRRYTEKDLELAEELGRRCAVAIDNAALFSSAEHAREAEDLANRAKDEFLAVVSHELRTPLNAILGWARMLATSAVDEDRRRRAIDTIERNAVAMAQLIEDLLDMSRVISGKLRLQVQAVEYGRVIEAALDSIKPAADAKGVRLVLNIEPGLPPVAGDPTRLQQVVWNLLSNAVKFTARDGQVEIYLRKAASSIELVVRDTGTGIDPKFLPHVFDPFRQQDAGSTRSRGGLGLGLAITRQLVELHGGRIRAESGGTGKGATFTVTLPISAVSTSSASSPSPSPSPSERARALDCPREISGLHILVVDDDADARTLIATVLEDCGCIVTTAGSVDEAMAALARAVPDVVLSDIGMPGRDGYDLIRDLRALPPGRGGDVPAGAHRLHARGGATPRAERGLLDAHREAGGARRARRRRRQLDALRAPTPRLITGCGSRVAHRDDVTMSGCARLNAETSSACSARSRPRNGECSFASDTFTGRCIVALPRSSLPGPPPRSCSLA